MSDPRILIIDDERAILESFEEYLEDYGYDILTASSGREGMEIFKEEKPDLILVDLRMPEVDGLEVLKKVSASSPLTPLIVVSGTGNVGDAAQALQNGAWDYLLKPVENLSFLRHAVEKGLEKSRLKKENLQYKDYLEKLVSERTLELKHANSHLEEVNQRLRNIVDTIKALSFCKDMQEFGVLLLKEFSQHMKAEGGSIYLKKINGLHLLHSIEGNHATTFIPFPLPENSVFDRAVKAKKPVLQNNLGAGDPVTQSGWEGYKNTSVLVFPIQDETGDLAALITFHDRVSPPFKEQDIEIGNILASYIGEALHAVKSNEQLADSEMRLRQILDFLPVGIFIIDAETDTVKYSNPHAASILDKKTDDIVEKKYRDVLHLQRLQRQEQYQPDKGEQLLLHVNDKEIIVLRQVALAVIEGRESYIECVLDITDQIKTKEEKEALHKQLLHADKMNALGTLAGGIAHDFNNILSAVIGYSDLCLLEVKTQEGSIYKKLQAIVGAANRARELVEQIRAFSRIQQQLMIPLNIDPVIREVVKFLSSSLPANIKIETYLNSNKPVLGDPTQIHQIIMNLCTNAYQAMEETGGTLSIELAEITINEQQLIAAPHLQPGSYLELTITDTGTGISHDILDKIFDPYFSTKGNILGTGLGLAIVNRIINQHNGTVSVQSEIGKGTTFHIYLPVTNAEVGEEEHQGSTLSKGTEHVLFIDDEETLLQIAAEMLQHLGYSVTTESNSLDAVEWFRKDPDQFDVIFTDYDMPDLNGMQLARELHIVRPDIPIILCTGYSDQIDQSRAKAVGIRKIVRKPFSMSELAEGVREALDT